MALVNASGKVRVFINEVNYSDYLIEGSTTDDSAYSTNIITSKGTITLGGDTSILDFNKTLFPLGSRVNIYATLDNGRLAKLPRGLLYVLNSTIDVNNRTTTLEVGCSLAFLSAREASYQDEVEGLIERFISYGTKSAFIIDNYDLSTLQNLLEIDGKVIFQDRWGYIQSVNQFGSDGLGSNLVYSKLTSFDKHTAIAVDSIGGAIEDLPSAVIVNANVEVPTGENTDDPLDSPEPPPFISSETFRTIKVPDIEKNPAFFEVVNDPTSGEASEESVAGCGSISDPNASDSDVTKYAYTAKGECTVVEREIQEKVIQGRYVSYEGPGNQVDWEYDFEYCSAGTYASGVLRSAVDAHATIANNEVERANSHLSKANQSYTLRDDYGNRPYTVIYTYSNGVLVNTETSEEGELIKAAFQYYGCAADTHFEAADNILSGAQRLAKAATEFADERIDEYGYSNLNQTFYTYGPGDAVIEKTELKYIHLAQSVQSQKSVTALKASYDLSADLNSLRYQVSRSSLDYSSFRVGYKSFDQVVSGNTLETSHSIKFNNPTLYFNLILASKTITSYEYGSVYTTETVEYFDYENPSAGYKRVSYSSTGSKDPIEPDRIEYQRDGNGCLYANDSAGKTENREFSYTQRLTISNPLSAPYVPISWLGRPTAQTKEVQLPLQFAPIRTKICNNTPIVPNLSQVSNQYYRLVQKYATNLIKKITSDNFGYRITEKGTRAELFGYYPFYPVALNLTSLGKSYKLRAASSTWAFDSNNVLCSIDCFNVGSIISIDSAPEVSPYIYSAFAKTEATVTLTNSYFKVPETATSIQINSLPATGTLNLNGSPVSVGDTITTAEIAGGLVTFVPSGAGTTNIVISFEVFDSSSNQISSDFGIYPPVQVEYHEILFADGGDFTANTTNGGYDGDAGEFNLGTRPGGNYQLNAGDFDTGSTVVSLEPAPPSGASASNGSVDPETELGTEVIDANDASISTDTLSTPVGNVNSNFEVVIEVALKPTIYLTLTTSVLPQLGWNYNRIKNSLGNNIDLGTVVDPNDYVMDFGTVLDPNQPVLASSVV